MNYEAASAGYEAKQREERDSSCKGPSSTKVHETKSNSDYLRALKDDPETIRYVASFCLKPCCALRFSLVKKERLMLKQKTNFIMGAQEVAFG